MSVKITKTAITGSSGATISGFDKIYNAVWNDYADSIEVPSTTIIEPGRCYYTDGRYYYKTRSYCQRGIIGIESDTFGFTTGTARSDNKNNTLRLNISIGGFVLAYVDRVYPAGTPLTSGPNGTLVRMRLLDRILHPERLVARYWKSESLESWNGVAVNGRHWVMVG